MNDPTCASQDEPVGAPTDPAEPPSLADQPREPDVTQESVGDEVEAQPGEGPEPTGP